MKTASEIAAGLSEAQKAGLMPCATHEQRAGLRKMGLVHWHKKPGHRFPSLRPTSLGYEVRAILRTEAIARVGEGS